MLLCVIFLRLNKPFLCNGLLDFETCLDIYNSGLYGWDQYNFLLLIITR